MRNRTSVRSVTGGRERAVVRESQIDEFKSWLCHSVVT